jgi:hypothetical protein
MPPVALRHRSHRRGAASADVLSHLRSGPGHRPRFDPGLAGGLRAWLEDGASTLVAARGDDAPPLFLGPRLLLADAIPPVRADPGRNDPAPLVLSCLVHALFRQLVTTGAVGDPLTDAIDALAQDPGRAGLVAHVNDLGASQRKALAAALTAHVTHLRDLTPEFAPGWLPRTHDRVAIPLAGGRVVLCGVFDLLVGVPVAGTASLCALQLTTGGPWALTRTSLHYLALLETLRSGSPPFRLGLIDTGLGRYVVEDVLEEHLRAIVSHLVMRLAGLAEVAEVAVSAEVDDPAEVGEDA